MGQRSQLAPWQGELSDAHGHSGGPVGSLAGALQGQSCDPASRAQSPGTRPVSSGLPGSLQRLGLRHRPGLTCRPLPTPRGVRGTPAWGFKVVISRACKGPAPHSGSPCTFDFKRL